MELWKSLAFGTWAEKTISLPCGDQFPLQKLKSIPSGVICFMPLPSSFTVSSA